MSSPAFPRLNALRTIINRSLDVFEQELANLGLSEPVPTDPESHPFDDPAYLLPPRLYEARRLLVASTSMLKSIVDPASEQVFDIWNSMSDASALNVVVHARVADVLADNDVDPRLGLPAAEIGERTGVNADKLVHFIRALATQNIFTETEPNVFANTRLSLFLRHDQPVAAMVRALTLMCSRFVQASWETLSDPKTAHSHEHDDGPFRKAMGTNGGLYEYMAQHPTTLKDFAFGLNAWGAASNPGLINDYPWEELGKKTVVDIGGGHGTLTIPLIEKHPNLSLVLQDRPEVCERAKEVLQASMPDAVESGRIVCEAHDFFKTQPRKGDEYVYVMRWCIHNWGQRECVQMLRAVRESMTPTSKLIICEVVLDQAGVASPDISVEETLDRVDRLPGTGQSGRYEAVQAPWPLTKNFGEAGKRAELSDVLMFNIVHGMERTREQFEDLAEQSGLEIAKIWPVRADKCGIIEFKVKSGANGA